MSRQGIPACALKVPLENNVHYHIVYNCIGKSMFYGLCLHHATQSHRPGRAR
ncbi:MAG: hypothetical protein IPQ13_08655 [Holophagaceae bacterium]|nr:hypothetical protein [Holophagaceae bacterium]